MFVGYALNHPGNCDRMWDPKTGRVRESLDVIWLKRMFYDKPGEEPKEVSPMEIDGVDGNEDGEGGSNCSDYDAEDQCNEAGAEEEETEDNVATQPAEPAATTTTRSGRTVKPPQRLMNEHGMMVKSEPYAIALTQAHQNYYSAMEEFPQEEFAPGEMACVGAGLGGGFTNTSELHVMKHDEAMAGPAVKE
jgi:hypothetical protein